MRFLKVIIFFFFLISTKLFATAQVPDYLIIEKDTLEIQGNPLEDYFKIHPIPDNLITLMSSSNWRGYVAYFKFLDGKLVVQNIYKGGYKEQDGKSNYFLTSIYKEIFGSEENFECNYYSGLLICPSGEIVEYVHMGYSSLYENYNLFEIKNGINVKSKKMTGEEFQSFKKGYFKYFRKKDEYKLKAKEFKEMLVEANMSSDLALEENSNKKKENKYLKQKEAEYHVDKRVDSFMFVYLNDYMKTIEIPLN